MNQLHTHWLKLCVAGLALAACSKDQSSPPPEHAQAPAAVAESSDVTASAQDQQQHPNAEALPPQVANAETSGAAASGALSDAQIMKVTETVDTGEVKQAELAQQRAKNPEVKQFAKHMISQHTKSKQQGEQLAKQIQAKPAQSPLSLELETEATQTLDSLKTADAASFDRDYVEVQVKQHQAVLNQIDQHLLPAASDPTLRSQLQQARQMVDAHLTEAKQLQSKVAMQR